MLLFALISVEHGHLRLHLAHLHAVVVPLEVVAVAAAATVQELPEKANFRPSWLRLNLSRPVDLNNYGMPDEKFIIIAIEVQLIHN